LAENIFQRSGVKWPITFTVSNTVYVTLRDLDQFGEFLGIVVQAGANQITGIQFDVADKTAALSEARKLAVENSRLMAEELAEAAGVSLGPVKSINYYGGNYPIAVQLERKMPAMAVDAVPISTCPGRGPNSRPTSPSTYQALWYKYKL
jgi:uncharacterized protein